MQRTAEIAQGVYWVGGTKDKGGLNCNPYLIIDGDEGVLIDPGSVLDFEEVYENISSLIDISKVKYVVLQHQDPDLCSSVPLFEERGANFKIVTHWRTQTLVKYYGIKSAFYKINIFEQSLSLKSGRRLNFVPTPYLHFPGAIATYDPTTKVIFTSDLFGAFSYDWSLFAGPDYVEKMMTFHEHYMPGNSVLRPVMEMFLNMDISIIAPQHGSVIRDNVAFYIKALRDLECGSFLAPIRKDLAKQGGYLAICNRIVGRLRSIYGEADTQAALQGLKAIWNEQHEMIDYDYTKESLWDSLFDIIYTNKGPDWLVIVEPLVRAIVEENGISLPQIFKSKLKDASETVFELMTRNAFLEEANKRLEKSLKDAEDRLLRCPLTGLYNRGFLQQYLQQEIGVASLQLLGNNPALLLLHLDNMRTIEFLYGNIEHDEVIKAAVILVKSVVDDSTTLFRADTHNFAIYLPHTSKNLVKQLAEIIRVALKSSASFIQQITASLSVVCLDEIKQSDFFGRASSTEFFNIALWRLHTAIDRGGDNVCSDTNEGDARHQGQKVLVADFDEVNLNILQTTLKSMGYDVLVAKDGQTATKIAKREVPLLIISEVMLPKRDGFSLRQEMMAWSETKNVPFLLMSHLKNEDSLKQAAGLGIVHYFQKPYMLSEVIGVIANELARRSEL